MFISTCFGENTSISKGDFFKWVFQKRFLVFFFHYSILFSHTYLSYPLLLQSYRDLCCERVLGDQSVEITKEFHLVFEETNLRVRVVSSSSVNSL